MDWKFRNLVGERFGKLIVLKQVEHDKWNQRQWLCKCDCGQSKVATTGILRRIQRSCGKSCLFKVKEGDNPSKSCKLCQKPTKSKWLVFCSEVCRRNHLSTLRGSEALHWLGDDVGYIGLHLWLRREFGSASHCEGVPDFECTGKSKHYDWAMIHEKGYRRKRENFRMLCKACHAKYDFTPERTAKAIKNLTWYKNSQKSNS